MTEIQNKLPDEVLEEIEDAKQKSRRSKTKYGSQIEGDSQ